MAEADLEVKTARSDNPFFSSQPVTKKTSSYDPNSFLAPYNPDDIVDKHQTYTIYEDMLKDDQVSVCLDLKKDLTLCGGFDFVCTGDGQEEIVEDLKLAFCDTEYPFEEMLEEILSFYEFGFSITEKVFQLRDDQKLSLKCLKTRHPGPWLFHQDEYGNVIRYEQRGVNGGTGNDVPAEALIHMINRRKFQNPYGTSDLRAAYQAWFTKKHITRWYAIFIEKAASPIPVAKYDHAKATAAAKTAIYNAIKNFQTKSAMLIPKEFEVDFLEASNTGDAFIKGINLFNMFIGRSLLVPDLLGFQGSETSGGSYALGKDQMDLFFRHIQRRREKIEQAVNKHLILPIVRWNWGLIDCYPMFKLRPISEDKIRYSIDKWLDATKANVYKPAQAEIDHFRNLVNFPIADDEAETESDDGEETEADESVIITETDDGDETVLGDAETEQEELTSKEKEFKSPPPPRKYKPTSGPFSGKTNVDIIEKNLDAALDRFGVNSAPLVREIVQDIVEQIQKRKIVEGQKVERIESVTAKRTSKIRTMLSKIFADVYKMGGEIAAQELFKSKFAKPIVDQEFLRILDEELYQFIGDWEYKINQKARSKIIEAIKDGKAISDLPELQKMGMESLDRYARTKFTEIMNKGRVAFFEKSGAVAGYQYSAILDDRTCFKADTLVRMADNSLRKISEVRPNEYVISGNGIARRVIATKRFISSEWRTIETEKNIKIQATKTHAFWSFRSGSFGWVEADNLSKSYRLGTKDLRSLSEKIHLECENKTKNILQSGMLLRPKKSKNDRKNMRALQQNIYGSRELVENASNRRTVLFQDMFVNGTDKGDTERRDDKSLHKMRLSIQNKTNRNFERFEPCALQQGVSETTNRSFMPELQQEISKSRDETKNILQFIMLPEMGWGNKFRNGGASRVGARGHSLPARIQDSKLLNRFCYSTLQNSLGVGWGILAPKFCRKRHEKIRPDNEIRFQIGSCHYGQMGGESSCAAMEADSHSIIPNADGSVGIKCITSSNEIAFCYDLEVENDHTYLITKSNIIVHNTEICRGLHGKTFKAGDQPVPPMHFNCRSMLIPITIYEEFTPDKTVGKMPIDEFIEKFKGDGFSKFDSEGKN